MSVSSESLISILADAMEDGSAAAPLELLEVLKDESHLLEVFSSRFGADAVSQAIEEAFPRGHWLWRGGPHPVPSDVRTIYVERLRWLRATLSQWSRASDGARSVFAGLLITARACWDQSSLWESLPDSFQPSSEFLAKAESVLTSYRIDYAGPAFGPARIWEREFMERFDAHDQAGRWDEIAMAWSSLRAVILPNPYVGELARSLARYDIAALARALDAQPKVIAIVMIVSSLSVGQQLRLAARCASKRAPFCLALSGLEKNPRREPLSGEEHAALVALLQHVMNDGSEWRLWMGAFNRYPVRLPSIQRPLGEALASAPLHAIEAYVDAISLNSAATDTVGDHDGRYQVGECLHTFAAHATLEVRQAMWRYAFRRWMEWRQSDESHLHGHFDIQWSELDYAVTSYAVECMSAEERERAMSDIQRELWHLDEVWHDSLTDYLTRANLLLSFLQPYAHAHAHAQGVGAGEDVLATRRVYWPFDLQGQPYFRQMFHVRERP